MSATKREEVSSHLRYIRLELREMHQMLIKDDLLPDINEAKEIPIQSLDIILIPLVVFDQSCNRIGMGSGFYDKALSALDNSKKKTYLIGLAYEFQKVNQIEPNKWDIPLDYVVTEKKVYHS